MSISTKGGDGGTTALLFGRRVPKTHPRVQAYGAVDELSAALGMVRAIAASEAAETAALLRSIQVELMALMAELAVDAADYDRWTAKGPTQIDGAAVERLGQAVKEREAAGSVFKGFDLPGESERHARCHLARAVCRRAERAVITLRDDADTPIRPELLAYLNRLSDLLWLLGREAV